MTRLEGCTTGAFGEPGSPTLHGMAYDDDDDDDKHKNAQAIETALESRLSMQNAKTSCFVGTNLGK